MDTAVGDEGVATLDAPGEYWVDLGMDAVAGDEGAATLDGPCGYWVRAGGEKGFVADGTVALIVDAP